MKKNNNKFRKIINKIHLTLGLSSGLVVFIVAITGCIFTFEKEIQDQTQPYRFVEKIGNKRIPLDKLVTVAENEFKDRTIFRILEREEEHSVIFLFYDDKGYNWVFIDPYTGEVLKNKNMFTDFFTIVEYIHTDLLLFDYNIGKNIIAISTIIFTIMLISGIILWWPKNKAAKKQRFKFKWKPTTKWKRKNYDLHNILGFYASWILIFSAITGLVWSYEWVEKGTYWLASGGKEIQENTLTSTPTEVIIQNPIQYITSKAQETFPDSKFTVIFMPQEKYNVYWVMTTEGIDQYFKSNSLYFDQYTLEVLEPNDIPERRFEQSSFSDKIHRINYDVHTGSIFGVFGKFIVFFAGIIASSLPVTGFFIWRGRKKKQNKISSR